MFNILSGLGALVNPASALASTLIGEIFGGQEEQQPAPAPVYTRAPQPQYVVAPPPPPPPVHPLTATGYFNAAFADGGEVVLPAMPKLPPMMQMAMGAGSGMPFSFGVLNPARQPLADGLNHWLAGGFTGPDAPGWEHMPKYAEGGGVEIPDEILVEQAMQAVAGMGDDPNGVIVEFVERFGDQALADLASRTRGMGDLNQNMPEEPWYTSQGMTNNSNIYQVPERGVFSSLSKSPRSGYFGGDMSLGTNSPYMSPRSMDARTLPGTAVKSDYDLKGYAQSTPGVVNPMLSAQPLRKDVDSYIPGIPEVKSDGKSDSIPARLSEGEYVVPADVVSGLGAGSTDAGVRKLMEMSERVRAVRAAEDRAKSKK